MRKFLIASCAAADAASKTIFRGLTLGFWLPVERTARCCSRQFPKPDPKSQYGRADKTKQSTFIRGKSQAL